MFCPYGSIEIELDNEKLKRSILADSPNKILIVNIGYWREFLSYSILCVCESEVYDEGNYIRNYENYMS